MSQNGPEKPNPPPTTRRILKGPAAPGRPTATGTHAAPTKSGASTVVKKSGDPPSTRVKAQTHKQPQVRPEDLHGEIEVVSSGAEEDATRVRSRVRGDHEGGPAPRGLGLRQKIMIAMASVTIVTSILIFVVVYVKAVGQLSDEIDSKGFAMTRLLQSVDPEVWLAAMHEDDAVRYERLTNLMKGFDDQWSENVSGQFFNANPPLRDEHEALYKGGVGEGRRRAALEFFKRVIEKRKERWTPAQQRAIDEGFRACTTNPDWLRSLNMLMDPFGEVKPLRAGACTKCKKHVAGFDKCPACAAPVTPYALASGEVVQMSVVDVTRSSDGDASVAAGDASKITRGGSRDVGGGIKVADGYVSDTKVPIRQYQLDQGPIETRAGSVKLRYFVLLSLTKIEDARSSLVWSIFLPILLAVCVGLAIAWWISERISEPVRILMDDINAVSAGDLDHKTQAHSSDEIGQLAVTFNRMTQALKAAHNQELEAKALEHELNIASEIQANLVPKKMLKLPGYDISAYYRPSKEVGGDYYDFIEIDELHHGLIVADVSGKGVPGSLVMSMARAFIRMEAERTRNNSPSSTLKHANRMLAADIKKGMFVTAMYCILNRETGELSISSAGHNPMVLWRAASGEIELINPKGIALGFDKGPVFERTVAEEKVQLQVGDRIVMYTDGTVEAMNERNEEYGDKRFFGMVQQLATRDSNQFLNLVVKSLDEHKGSAPQHDDMTIVTLRYTGGGAQA